MDQSQNNTPMNNNPEAGERTFTQEEVNRIISERLGRDREKRSIELDEREKAVKLRELAVLAAEKLADAGLPKELSDVLKYDDETTLDGAIQTLSKLRGFSDGGKKDTKEIIPNKLVFGNIEDDDFITKIKKAFEIPKE